jgi:hypothetical protein
MRGETTVWKQRTNLVSGLGMLLTLIVAFPSLCLPASITLPVKAQTIIADGKGETRLLVDFGSLDTLAGYQILYAKCFLDIDVDSCVLQAKEVEVRALTDAWTPGTVDWNTTWSKPGGDISEDFATFANIQKGRNGDTEIHLTGLIQAWVDSDMANFGLVLIPFIKGCDYSLTASNAYPSGGVGKLFVRYKVLDE